MADPHILTRTTRQVVRHLNEAHALNCNYWTLMEIIRTDKIRKPEKSERGDYQWGPGDVEAARAAIAGMIRRPRRAQGVACG